jgi:secreted trypsin-like serine protease
MLNYTVAFTILIGLSFTAKTECLNEFFNLFKSSSVATNCGTRLGKGTYDNRWPWVVSIQVTATNKNNNASRSIIGHNCGGALIANDTVLTAAHCLKGFAPSELVVVAGAANLDAAVKSEKRVYEVASFVVHPAYDPTTVENDIALLKLTRPILFDTDVAAICLPKSERKSNIFGKDLIMAGW